MALEKISFTPASFGRAPGGSFTSTLRQNRADEENKRRYEIAQDRLAQQDAIAAQDRAAQNLRLSTADTRAQTTFDQSQADRIRAQKAAEVAGAVAPVEATYEQVTPTGVNVTDDMRTSLQEYYNSPEGRTILEQDPELAALKGAVTAEGPAPLAIDPRMDLANQITLGQQEGQALYGDTGIVQPEDVRATNILQNIPQPVSPAEPAITPTIDFEISATGDLVPKDPTGDYEARRKKLSDSAIQKEISRISGIQYDQTETKYRTPAEFKKAQVDNINKVMDEQKVPKKDRALVRMTALTSLGGRATEHSKVVQNHIKDISAQRIAETKAKSEVQKTATTQREKANAQYYKNQEADLKRLDNDRTTMAKLYSDDKFDKDYLAKDAAIKAQQQRIRDTLKKQ